nr:hypothetical protein [uncultured Prevotella sp.]
MNKITYSLLALILAFMSMRSTSAQTANGTPWMGHAIDPTQKQFYLIDKDGKNNSITQENTLYLVNVAACKEARNSRIFFNQGGHWGTEASLFEIGIPIWLLHKGTGTKGRAIVGRSGGFHPPAPQFPFLWSLSLCVRAILVCRFQRVRLLYPSDHPG